MSTIIGNCRSKWAQSAPFYWKVKFHLVMVVCIWASEGATKLVRDSAVSCWLLYAHQRHPVRLWDWVHQFQFIMVQQQRNKHAHLLGFSAKSQEISNQLVVHPNSKKKKTITTECEKGDQRDRQRTFQGNGTCQHRRQCRWKDLCSPRCPVLGNSFRDNSRHMVKWIGAVGVNSFLLLSSREVERALFQLPSTVLVKTHQGWHTGFHLCLVWSQSILYEI